MNIITSYYFRNITTILLFIVIVSNITASDPVKTNKNERDRKGKLTEGIK